MNQPSHQLPRFIPTLTEVVDPATLANMRPKNPPDAEALITKIRGQMQPIWERRLQEELDRVVRAMVVKQLGDVRSRLSTEMDMLIRQAVTDVLRDQERAKLE
ncbi:hypothetical protein [Rhodoferax sp.]|uniref:hypothetical protein n=1 Tax=Rhodoferax sp. TaxID=50421 RepID=UPI00260E4C97|nr:hypothetical protein [Rhodoferax sp.]MDD2923644.1 hypothetical protein [Rhodoferax sp.]